MYGVVGYRGKEEEGMSVLGVLGWEGGWFLGSRGEDTRSGKVSGDRCCVVLMRVDVC